jgi:hypothetical protein
MEYYMEVGVSVSQYSRNLGGQIRLSVLRKRNKDILTRLNYDLSEVVVETRGVGSLDY